MLAFARRVNARCIAPRTCFCWCRAMVWKARDLPTPGVVVRRACQNNAPAGTIAEIILSLFARPRCSKYGGMPHLHQQTLGSAVSLTRERRAESSRTPRGISSNAMFACLALAISPSPCSIFSRARSISTIVLASIAHEHYGER